MIRSLYACVPVAVASLTNSANAFTFTMTPVTNTTSNFAGTILIQGTVSLGVGESFLHPTVMSSQIMPFLSTYTAGFNGPGQGFDPAFLAWNGVGSYTGPIYNHQIGPGNFGYSGGMPLGLYGSNLLGPGAQSGIILHYVDANGLDHGVFAPHAINVIPAPGALALAAVGGCVVVRRRR